MTTLTIPHPREDAKTVVKAAFEDTEGIETYYDDGTRITGKTGGSLGLLVSSYGESVVVDVPHNQRRDDETEITVIGEREVSANIGADPEKYVSRFVRSLNAIKNEDVDVILETLAANDVDRRSKEVADPGEQAGGSWALKLVMAAIFVMFLFILFI